VNKSDFSVYKIVAAFVLYSFSLLEAAFVIVVPSICRLQELYGRKSIQHLFGHLPFVRLKACVGWYQIITVKLKISV